MNHELIRLALAAGAKKAAIIKTEDIVLSSVFRDICASNACGKYGRCWMCPPDIGEIDTLMAQLKSYRSGLLYQTIYAIEDSFDIEGMQDAGRRHVLVSQRLEAFLMLKLGKHLHLSCGGCRLCERCAKLDGLPCRDPERAMPSMEGYGIDVYNTCKPTELKYINGQNTVTYFGIVLY
jgi:predicted metal-binding protein